MQDTLIVKLDMCFLVNVSLQSHFIVKALKKTNSSILPFNHLLLQQKATSVHVQGFYIFLIKVEMNK